MGKYLAVLAVGAMLLMLPWVSLAQEEEKAGEVSYSFGIAGKADTSKNELVVSEYDWEKEEETKINITYSVPPDAEFENVSSLGEIASGDEISIEYLVDEAGKRIAKFISVYKEESEPEPAEPIMEGR